MTLDQVLIKTPLGNSLLPLNSSVYVRVINGVFTERTAGDLREGDSVLMYDEGYDLPFEEIRPHFHKSDRYDAAHKQVHVYNKEKYTSKFRYDLVTGLSREIMHEKFDKSNLEKKIFEENGASFTFKESQLLYNKLSNKMSSYSHKYAEKTLREWLKGDTLAPRDWEVLTHLSSTIPAFSSYEKKVIDGGIKDAYELVVGVHKGVSSYIARRKNTGTTTKSQSGDRTKKEEFISIKPEAQIIIYEFLDRISSDKQAVYVTEVQTISSQGSGSSNKTTTQFEKLLTRGVVTKLNEPLPIFNVDKLYGMNESLFMAFVFAYREYIEKYPSIRNEPYVIPFIKAGLKVTDSLGLARLLSYNIQHVFAMDSITVIQPGANQNAQEIAQASFDKLAENLRSGVVDLELGLEPTTLYKTLSSASKLKEAFLHQSLRSKDQSQVESYITALSKTKDVFSAANVTHDIFVAAYEKPSTLLSVVDHAESVIKHMNRDGYREAESGRMTVALQRHLHQGERFMTRDEFNKNLECAGLSCLSKYVPEKVFLL